MKDKYADLPNEIKQAHFDKLNQYKEKLDIPRSWHQSDDPDAFDIIYSCNHYMGLEYERKIRPWYFACRVGTSVASIQYNGNISACLDIERRLELTYGNIRNDNFY